MADQLVEIGTNLGGCWRRITEIQDECLRLPDNGSLADWKRRIRLKQDEQCLAERTYALEIMATHLRARSLPAALVQVVMAHRFLREVMDSDLDERERMAACRSVERLLYSVGDCLEAEAKQRREEIFGTAYMARAQDPFRCVQDALPAGDGQPDRPGRRARDRSCLCDRDEDAGQEATF